MKRPIVFAVGRSAGIGVVSSGAHQDGFIETKSTSSASLA
jgi:hypothetical protein